MKSQAQTRVQLLMMLEVVLVGVVMLAMPTAGRPDGAPSSACSSLTPGHGANTESLPYTIEVSSTTFQANGDITVTVKGGDFAGILMQVRGVGTNTGTIYGTWKNPPANIKILNCSGGANSVTHSDTVAKRDSVFTWTAPNSINQDLEVVATVAQSMSTWKMNIKSSPLTPAGSAATTTTAVTPTTESGAGTAFFWTLGSSRENVPKKILLLLPYVALSLMTLGINM